ncbi:galactokinase [Thermotoga sp. KOL6]|uniref:galactokinase n=1 Tax=Thermotoga sp. KOL6 TaxID=126741 RepID=UPI000C7597C1|nr:galactokinase [Thermotoga sp. KOL6]PLV59920.1 galactokinase [Thermotoga sp. KOL6]
MKVKAPGRVNIIGEHTDYNDGYVLPFAVNKFVFLSLERTKKFIFHSETMNETVEMDEPKKLNKWTDYISGVIRAFEKRGFVVPPVKIVISSNLPVGVGLSSSAALEVAAAYAISEHFGFNVTKLELVRIAREAEVEFVGVKCGIMDQFTSAFGKKGHAIFLDTMTLNYEYVPLELEGVEINLVDSNVKHELSSSEYNKRRQECEEVLRILGKKSFREVKLEELGKLPGTLKKRAQHVLEENERVLKSVQALRKRDFEMLGKLLFSSHESLRDLYEVSCEETDFIVEFLRKKEGVLGARMVGGGFGGGVIVLSKKGVFEKIKEDLARSYKKRFEIDLTFHKIESADGVQKI